MNENRVTANFSGNSICIVEECNKKGIHPW